jgi:tetratricopeptide (TPR) repeat protein
MSATRTFKQASELLAGRWQVPLALVAAVVASVTLYRLIPPAAPLDFDGLMAGAAALEQTEGVPAAADALAKLLEQESRLPSAQQAALHDRLAELRFRAEQGQAVHKVNAAREVLEHDRIATELGRTASPRVILRDARAAQWAGESEMAIAGFRAALGTELALADRRAALQALVELLEDRPEARDEQRQVITELLNEEGVSPAYLWWGLHRAIGDALDENDVARAHELLTQYGDKLKSSDLKGYLDYLTAYVALREGRPEEAAPLVRWVDDWLGSNTRSTRELDDFGHLPSLNRWLSGKTHLTSGELPEALADFEEALEYHPAPELRAIIQLGRGAALGALDRHAVALEAFRAAAVDGAALPPERRRATFEELARTVTEFAQRRQAQGDFDSALPYLGLAAETTPDEDPQRQEERFEQLGRTYQLAARAATDAETRRRYHEQAGHNLERAAALAKFEERRLAELLWSAADEYDSSGRIADTQRMLRQFVEGRSSHPDMPRALLQLGRTYEAGGELDEALAWYARVMAEYPRLEEAAHAKVLAAGVLVSKGPQHYADAEHLLGDLLTDGSVAPDAAVYRDALLALSELVYHQGRYGEAIGRLQDFLALYPDDPERIRERFTLGDAYRRSAYLLRDDASAATANVVTAESRQRFRRAVELYDELLGTLEGQDGADEEAQVYTRLAMLYRADCLFELNEPDSLRAAMAGYRATAARYETQPVALTAQVQVANVCLRLGELPEAARAVERARWLLRTMPAENFARSRGSDRAAWEHFLSLVASSDLFQVGLTSAAWGPGTSQEEH